MKQIVKRCLNIGSDVLGFVRIGSSSLSLINKDKDIKGILNGCEIFKVSNFKDSRDSLTYVMGDLIQNIYKNKPECFPVYRNLWSSDKYPMREMLDSIIANVKDKVKISVKVRSKESSSSFDSSFRINENINIDVLNKNIRVFDTRIKNASIVLQNFIKNAFIILNHKYGNSDNMWGVGNIKKYMEDIKSKIASNDVEIGKLDFYTEMLERNSNKLSLKVASVSVMNNPEEKKMVSQVLIPDMVNNYEKFKDLTTKTIVILSPLIYVDDLFKKNTNYPANWFVSDDVLMNIGEDYNFLINFMQDIPKIENNVIVPLEVYGSKISK
jgi:hypothetical protein